MLPQANLVSTQYECHGLIWYLAEAESSDDPEEDMQQIPEWLAQIEDCYSLVCFLCSVFPRILTRHSTNATHRYSSFTSLHRLTISRSRPKKTNEPKNISNTWYVQISSNNILLSNLSIYPPHRRTNFPVSNTSHICATRSKRRCYPVVSRPRQTEWPMYPSGSGSLRNTASRSMRRSCGLRNSTRF